MSPSKNPYSWGDLVSITNNKAVDNEKWKAWKKYEGMSQQKARSLFENKIVDLCKKKDWKLFGKLGEKWDQKSYEEWTKQF